MALADGLFVNAVVELDSTADPLRLIGGLTDQRQLNNIDVRGGATSGTIFEEHQSIYQRRPEMTFVSHSLDNVLAGVPLLGRAFKELIAARKGFTMFVQGVDPCGTRTTGATHRSYHAQRGLCVMQSLAANHQEDAVITARMIPVLDTDGSPIVEVDPAVVLPATFTDPPGAIGNTRFSLFTGSINNVAIGGFTALALDFGLSTPQLDADGTIDTEQVYIDMIAPRLSLTGLKPEWFSETIGGVPGPNIPLGGVAALEVNSIFFLRKRKSLDEFEPLNSAVHISIEFNALATVQSGYAASGRGTGQIDLLMSTVHTGTNQPITVTPNVTIP